MCSLFPKQPFRFPFHAIFVILWFTIFRKNIQILWFQNPQNILGLLLNRRQSFKTIQNRTKQVQLICYYMLGFSLRKELFLSGTQITTFKSWNSNTRSSEKKNDEYRNYMQKISYCNAQQNKYFSRRYFDIMQRKTIYMKRYSLFSRKNYKKYQFVVYWISKESWKRST